MKQIGIIALLCGFAISLIICSSDTILATSTSVEVDIHGDISRAVPDHASVGFRRWEFVNSESSTHGDSSVLAKLDSTTTWNKGAAIEQTSATDRAADLIARASIEQFKAHSPQDSLTTFEYESGARRYQGGTSHFN